LERDTILPLIGSLVREWSGGRWRVDVTEPHAVILVEILGVRLECFLDIHMELLADMDGHGMTVMLSLLMPIPLSIYLSTVSIFLSIFLSIYLSIFLSISLSFSLSVYLSVYLSIYLSFSLLSTPIHSTMFIIPLMMMNSYSPSVVPRSSPSSMRGID
jgi:hypothetical protein